MGDLYDLQSYRLHSFHDRLFLLINDTGGNVNAAGFQLMKDHRRQRYEHIRKDICHYNVIFLIANCILYRFICNDISDHDIHGSLRNPIYLEVLLCRRDRTRIKIRSDSMLCSELQRYDREDTASGPDIEQLCIAVHILFQLSHTQLCRLMHTGAKGRTRINMNNHLVLILSLYFLPGRNDQNIIHIKLVEILFPVVDPVLILGLSALNRAFTQIHKAAVCLQLLIHAGQDCLRVRILLQIKAKVGDPVICRTVRQNVYKHLLLVRLRKRHLVLDLHTLDSGVRQCGDDDILRIGLCL